MKDKNTNEKDDISFIGKVIMLFRVVWEKIKGIKLITRIKNRQRALAHYNGIESSEESKISYTFGLMKIVSIALLIVLLCLTLVFGDGIISYENVYYMFKDIEYINTYGESRPEQLNYSKPIARQDFEMFKNGLAVASDSEIKLFTSTGRVTMTRGSEFSNPKLSASASNLLIYDQGNRNFAIYNSFTELYREKLDFPIASADMSESGYYAIVTKNVEYTSVVRVYNSRNVLYREYFKNDYIISSPISDDGKHLAVMSMSASGGESLVELTVVDIKKGSTKAKIKISDAMPYKCEFISDNRIAAFFSDHVAVYDLSLSQKRKYEYPSKLNTISCADGGFVLCMSGEGIASNNLIAVFDINGNVTYNGNVVGDIYDAKLDGTYAYVLTGDAVYRLDTRFGSILRINFSSENSRLAVFEGGAVGVCTSAAAYYISFD